MLLYVVMFVKLCPRKLLFDYVIKIERNRLIIIIGYKKCVMEIKNLFVTPFCN